MRIKEKRLYIQKKEMVLWIYLLLLLVPDDVYTFGSIYQSVTPYYISYNWLNYSFGLILLFLLIWVLLSAFINLRRGYFALIVFLLLRECVFWIGGYNNIFSEERYEIILTLVIGIGLAYCIFDYLKCVPEFEKFFWIMIYSNILTVYISVIGSFNGIKGRYNASNLDVGMTGTICGMALVKLFLDKQEEWRILKMITIAMILLLSDSRANILLTFIFIVIAWLFTREWQIRLSTKKILGIILGVMFLCVSIVIFLYLGGKEYISDLLSLNRMLQFDITVFQSDSSYIGRLRSIMVAFDIIKENWFGISANFINIQQKTVSKGFDTFPHSMFLSYYILLGPIVIILLVHIIRNLLILMKSNSTYFFVLGYAFAFTLFSGGPVVNFKIIYIYTSCILISNYYVKRARNNERKAISKSCDYI